MAYLLTAFVGPSLVSPDVSNNAMPLYFCRPFSRTEYVIGKNERAAVSALADHLGSRADPVRDSGEPGGMGVDASDNWWIAGALFVGLVDLDRGAVSDRAGDVGVGEMESRGRRADPGHLFRRRGIRRGDQRGDAHQVRIADRI